MILVTARRAVAGTAGRGGGCCDAWFVLEFQAADGSWQRGPLSSCCGVRFEDALPVRPFRFEKGLRSFAGWWWLATTGRHVGYRVVAGAGSPDAAGLRPGGDGLCRRSRSGCAGDGDGRARRHAPDFFARLLTGRGVVIDVRPDDRIPERDAETFAVTARACEAGGLGVPPGRGAGPGAGGERAVAVALPAPAVRGAGDRRGAAGAFAGGRGLFEGAGLAGDRLQVLPVLFHLMWQRQLAADLAAAPLGAATWSCTQAGHGERRAAASGRDR